MLRERLERPTKLSDTSGAPNSAPNALHSCKNNQKKTRRCETNESDCGDGYVGRVSEGGRPRASAKRELTSSRCLRRIIVIHQER